jgi:transcriptional regulator GlxA family with amidase domain
VEADRILVWDGQISTSVGMSAGIDLTLAIVEEDHRIEMRGR